MHAVVDTNVLVSGRLSPHGPHGGVVRAILAGTLLPVVCEATVDAYRRVLPRSRLRINAARLSELLTLMERTGHWVPVPAFTGNPPLPDPDDWSFLAAALAAGCPVITGNARHFPKALGVRVMSARESLEGSGASWPD